MMKSTSKMPVSHVKGGEILIQIVPSGDQDAQHSRSVLESTLASCHHLRALFQYTENGVGMGLAVVKGR